MCYLLTCDPIQGSKTEQLKQRLRAFETRISYRIWTKSIPYECHAPIIDTCVRRQSACLKATIVSLLSINSVLFLLRSW